MSESDYKIDASTGMPVVPDGYFWRVRTYQGDYDYNPNLVVELHKRTPHWWNKDATEKVGSKEVACENMRHEWTTWRGDKAYSASTPQEVTNGVPWLADKVYQAHKGRLAQEQATVLLKARLKQVVGDYPPKKLEA